MPSADSGNDAEQAAIRLLAIREHSRHELAVKLHRRFDKDVVSALLDDLKARNLQSDERFTELYVQHRIDKGYGPLRIRAELEQKGIEPQLINAWLDDDRRFWRQRLRAAADARFGAIPAPDRKEQARRARFLESRGFSPSLIRGYLWD